MRRLRGKGRSARQPVVQQALAGQQRSARSRYRDDPIFESGALDWRLYDFDGAVAFSLSEEEERKRKEAEQCISQASSSDEMSDSSLSESALNESYLNIPYDRLENPEPSAPEVVSSVLGGDEAEEENSDENYELRRVVNPETITNVIEDFFLFGGRLPIPQVTLEKTELDVKCKKILELETDSESESDDEESDSEEATNTVSGRSTRVAIGCLGN